MLLMSAGDNLRRGDGKVVDQVFGLKGRDEIEGNVKKLSDTVNNATPHLRNFNRLALNPPAVDSGCSEVRASFGCRSVSESSGSPARPGLDLVERLTPVFPQARLVTICGGTSNLFLLEAISQVDNRARSSAPGATGNSRTPA